MYSLQGNTRLTQAPACPRRTPSEATQVVCVDYVQSQRDNAGDTMLFLLFTRDARVSVR